MLTHPTLDQLRALKLDGMADAFVELQAQDNARDLSHAEWLALLLDREAASMRKPEAEAAVSTSDTSSTATTQTKPSKGARK